MHPAYFETNFRVEDVAAEWPSQFVIVTAHATTGEIWDASQNDQADERLQRVLADRGVWIRRITGYSPTTGHAEPGWAVALDWSAGCNLGADFAQDAIYYVDGDTLYVTHCDARRKLVPVGTFRMRLR